MSSNIRKTTKAEEIFYAVIGAIALIFGTFTGFTVIQQWNEHSGTTIAVGILAALVFVCGGIFVLIVTLPIRPKTWERKK